MPQVAPEAEPRSPDLPMSPEEATAFQRAVDRARQAPESEPVVDADFEQLDPSAQEAILELEDEWREEEEALVHQAEEKKLELLKKILRELDLDSAKGVFLYVAEWMPFVGLMYAVTGREAVTVKDAQTGEISYEMREIDMIDRAMYLFGEFYGSGKGTVSIKRAMSKGIRAALKEVWVYAAKRAGKVLVRRAEHAAKRRAKKAITGKSE